MTHKTVQVKGQNILSLRVCELHQIQIGEGTEDSTAAFAFDLRSLS